MKTLSTIKPNVFIYRRFALWPRRINGHWVCLDYFWTKVVILPAEYLPLIYREEESYTDEECLVQIMVGNFIDDSNGNKKDV